MNDPIVLYDGPNRLLLLLRPDENALGRGWAGGMSPPCPRCGMIPLLLVASHSEFIETRCPNGHESWIFSRNRSVIR